MRAAAAQVALQRLRDLGIRRRRLAREQSLSTYDASYLALAMRQGLPLATQDARLSAAAMRSSMPLVR